MMFTWELTMDCLMRSSDMLKFWMDPYSSISMIGSLKPQCFRRNYGDSNVKDLK